MSRLRFARVGPILVAVLLAEILAATPAAAQFDRLRRSASEAAQRLIDPGDLIGGDPPITTSLSDARFGDPAMDGFEPGVPARSLLELQRTAGGGFVLQPGFWEMHTQSYCLKAGTHGPGGGDGYIFAPPLGPAENAVKTIVRNSVAHPEIAQRDIQVLLWAIIARAKFEEMDRSLQATASRLLSAEEIALLNRNALDIVPGEALDRVLEELPPLVRQVLRAEAEIRQALTTPGTSFEQVERLAVLAGVPALGEGSLEIPSGRWSLHPDGYYVRYLPRGYSHTLTQVWVPEGSAGVGREYDAATHIAVPGNTARQRLIQSGRERAGDH